MKTYYKFENHVVKYSAIMPFGATLNIDRSSKTLQKLISVKKFKLFNPLTPKTPFDDATLGPYYRISKSVRNFTVLNFSRWRIDLNFNAI